MTTTTRQLITALAFIASATGLGITFAHAADGAKTLPMGAACVLFALAGLLNGYAAYASWRAERAPTDGR